MNTGGTMNDDLEIHCNPLDNLSQSSVCPIKLLLALALRLGRVQGATLDEVLQQTARRANATIQWTDPDAPVSCQMNGHPPFLLLDKPAGQEQIRYSLQQMAEKSGLLLDRIDTRSLRRGALRDKAYLEKLVAGVASRATAMIAGHSYLSYSNGTTRQYVGDLEASMFNLRAEHQRVDAKAPAFAQEPPPVEVLRKRFSPHDIDEYMGTHNMETTDRKARRRAGVAMKKQSADAWCQTARDQPLVKDSSVKHMAVSRPPPQLLTDSEANPQSKSTEARSKNKTINDAEEPKYFGEDLTFEPDSVQFDEALLDPQLKEYDREIRLLQKACMDSVADSIFLNTEVLTKDNLAQIDTADLADSLDEAMLDEHIPGNEANASGFITPRQGLQLSDISAMNGDDFVRFFSRINVFYNQHKWDRSDTVEVVKQVPSGSGRDTPIAFLYYCSKGCGHSHYTSVAIRTHEINCTGGAATIRTVLCSRGCGKTFKHLASMKTHVERIHYWVPIACVECPDKPDVIFALERELRNHREKVHKALAEAIACPLEDKCHSGLIFTNTSVPRKHLTTQHQLTRAEIMVYVPDARQGNSNKGKKRRLKGWYLAPGPVRETEAGTEEGDGDEEEQDCHEEEEQLYPGF